MFSVAWCSAVYSITQNTCFHSFTYSIVDVHIIVLVVHVKLGGMGGTAGANISLRKNQRGCRLRP